MYKYTSTYKVIHFQVHSRGSSTFFGLEERQVTEEIFCYFAKPSHSSRTLGSRKRGRILEDSIYDLMSTVSGKRKHRKAFKKHRIKMRFQGKDCSSDLMFKGRKITITEWKLGRNLKWNTWGEKPRSPPNRNFKATIEAVHGVKKVKRTCDAWKRLMKTHTHSSLQLHLALQGLLSGSSKPHPANTLRGFSI